MSFSNVHFKFDDVLMKVGELGKYQVVLYILVGLVGLPAAWQTLAMVFLGGKVDFWCADEDSLDGPPPWISSNVSNHNESSHRSSSGCTKTVYTGESIINSDIDFIYNSSDLATRKCTKWVYDKSMYESTIVSEYNLVCGDEWKVSVATSIYMGGFLVGTVLFGAISDRIGRHKTLMVCVLLQIVFGVAGAFAPVYSAFVILRFIVGAASAGAFTVGFVIVMETIGPTKRMTPGIFFQCWFAVGIMIQAGVAYGVRDHVYFQLACALPAVFFLSYWWIVAESPRWLVFAGKLLEAETLVKKIAKINGRSEVILTEMLRRKQTGALDESGPKPSIFDVFRAPNLRRRTFNICCHWFVISMVYYGLSLGSGSLGGSVYVNHFLSGLVEIPSYFLTIFTIDRFGRKKVMMALHIFGGIACLACTPLLDIPHLQPLLVTCAMMGKFAVAANFAVIYVYSAEVFPTVVRNVGVGTGSMCARIGSLLAPQISRLDSVWRPFPFLIYGALPILASLLVLCLPETLNQKLPETIEDGEKFGLSHTIYEEDISVDDDRMEENPLKEMP